MPKRLTFRRSQRIRLQRDFARVFHRRCSVADPHLVLYVDDAGLAHPRLGLRVGRRVGGAVVRNREKRRIREAFRARQHDLPPLDMIVVLNRAGRSTCEYAEALMTLARAAQRKLLRRVGQRS